MRSVHDGFWNRIERGVNRVPQVAECNRYAASNWGDGFFGDDFKDVSDSSNDLGLPFIE